MTSMLKRIQDVAGGNTDPFDITQHRQSYYQWPLVSCCCVSNSTRKHHLEKSIDHFLAQTYPNLELVVVSHDEIFEEQQQKALPKNIRFFRCSPKLTLGSKRQFALEQSRGTIYCHWDDDDYFHPLRLFYQIFHLFASGKQACVLGDICHLVKDALYLERWHRVGVPASILAYKRYCPSYIDSDTSEDSYFMRMLDCGILYGAPWLFTYIFHGTNLCSLDHHNKLVELYGTFQYNDQLIQETLSRIPEQYKNLYRG